MINETVELDLGIYLRSGTYADLEGFRYCHRSSLVGSMTKRLLGTVFYLETFKTDTLPEFIYLCRNGI